jgi:Zn-dependent membrane protease YugP
MKNMFNYNIGYLLVIPAIIFTLIAQTRVKGTFNKYLKVPNTRGYTGAQVARDILDRNGLRDVRIETVGGYLSDHYDPRSHVLRLSPQVYNGNSIASISVAAHEAGHAIQHGVGYVPLNLRNTLAPIASFGAQAVWFLVFAGFALQMLALIDVGIVLYAAAVIFQIITLPVEFNASSRALEQLEINGFITANEVSPARSVLNAAALTYVAAMAVSVAQLIRLVLLRGRRD